MEHLYFLLGLAAIVLLAFLLNLRRSLSKRFRFPYLADRTLFTPSQRAFQAVLEEAVGKSYRVYGRVRVADIVDVRPRLARRDRERAYARLGEYCFDFVVCRPDTSAIACAINLAPRARLRKSLPRDRLDRICAAAQLPFVRFRESEHYVLSDVQERIAAAMQLRVTGAKHDEIPCDEAADVLHQLSGEIRETEREPRLPSLSLHKTASAALQSPSPRSQSVAVEPGQRLEPIVPDRGGIDEGPIFKLDGDLDDR